MAECRSGLHDAQSEHATYRRHGTVLLRHVPVQPLHRTRPGRRDEGLGAWESLAAWYTAKTGVDNSTLLQPTTEAPYAFVNYARLPHSGARFLLAQMVRPSFHTYVRRLLDKNGMVALPLLCKPA